MPKHPTSRVDVVLNTLSGRKIRIRRFGSSGWLPPCWAYSVALRIRTQTLERVLELVERELNASKKYVERKLNDPRINAERLDEIYLQDVWDNEDLCIKVEQLAMVGLYSLIELTLKSILSWVYHEGVQKDNLYKWDKMDNRLKLDLGIDLASIDCCGAVDELRCLSNSIKHSGKVNAQLARFPGWKEDAEIKRVGKHFERMRKAALLFVDSFVKRLDAELRKLAPAGKKP